MRKKQVLIFLFLLSVSVGCDHATKQIAQAALDGGPIISLAADTLRFQLALNPGAFLSLGAALPEWVRDTLFLGVIPILLAAVCFQALRVGFTTRGPVVGLALVAGGGLANWLDRALHGGVVTDFVSLGVGPVRTGIFNVADVLIVVGAAVLFWTIRERSDPATRAA